MAQVMRRRIVIEGLVQGVGFRPFVYREAVRRGLHGHVRNVSAGVLIDVEGQADVLREFTRHIRTSPPLHAAISSVRSESAPPCAYTSFVIEESADEAENATLVSNDIATCDDCVRELFDPADRRFGYPFLNCTACGPRFTIQQGVPYDRARTTMSGFAMCGTCRAEYENPEDRRFHAQPIACPECGPSLRATATDMAELASERTALALSVAELLAGRIVAIKGLGGYHLACDATSPEAVGTLRNRKNRETKPFAIMTADVDAACALCELGVEEAELLASSTRPIVLLRKRENCPIADDVAPGNPWLGVMLPYTPLHHLLLRAVGRPVVMTSGNRSDEPIATDDADAVDRLGRIADVFLTHDRPIAVRCDDSVMRVQSGAPAFLRRSRGCAPLPILMKSRAASPVLGVGGHLKNTFCLVREDQAFVSQHIGDLENLHAYAALLDGIDQFSKLLGVAPRVIAHDLHPDYLSTRAALGMPATRRIAVQHHHAHVAACALEHGVSEPVLGVAFDGTGLGTDGAIWGGEFLLVEKHRFERVAHLGYVPLLGGEGAVRHPARMAAAHLMAVYGADLRGLTLPLTDAFARGELELLRQMYERRLHSPHTSSMGRLFDAVSALAGVCTVARHEGEAAMALEFASDPATTGSYGFDVSDTADALVLEPASVIAAVVADVAAGEPPSTIGARFHNGLRDVIVDVAVRVRARTGVGCVALTGGVFQNVLLTERAVAALVARGFKVLLHRRVPCNDGGLSLGQAAVACATMEMA